MPRRKDPFWEYMLDEGGKIRCGFCQEQFVGTITRMKVHLSKLAQRDVRPCPTVPDSVSKMALRAISELDSRKKTKISNFLKPTGGNSSPGSAASSTCGLIPLEAQPLKITSLMKNEEKELADNALVKFLVAHNLPFSLLMSDEFREAIMAVANHGPGYVPPSSEALRMKILPSLKEEVEEYIKEIKKSWVLSGCTLMLDPWTDGQKRPHINLLASSSKGTILLKSECMTRKDKDDNYIANFISSGIEEVGHENVVQFISDSASIYNSAEFVIEQRFPNIFKSSCAVHCLDIILKEIDKLPNVEPILATARKLVKFFYKYQHVLDLMRSHTNGKGLIRPDATRFVTQFMCLQSIVKEEQALRFMVASSEWRALPQSKMEEGIELMNTIQGDVFWDSGKEILSTVEPLVKVLRMVDGDGSTMGYLYESMNKAKDVIKEIYKGDSEKFMPYWKIIDEQWNQNLHSPLHAVAAYLNPHLFYDKFVKLDKQVKVGFEKVREKMVLSDEKMNLTKELKLYHLRDPCLFGSMAIEALHESHPRVWWDMWGAEFPILRKLAIKLLSQPCRALACERNWSAFKVARMKNGNRLKQKKLHDLFFFRMNLRLMKKSASKDLKDSEPINLDNILAFPNAPPPGEEDDFEDDAYQSTNESSENEEKVDIDHDMRFDDVDNLMSSS